MKCVMLAAGEGERLKEYEGTLPKPLCRILGLTLIERVLLTFSKCGINQFLLATGYKSNEIKKFLGDGSKYGVSIEYQYNPQWYKGNGSSLHALKERLSGSERFLVTMSDHVFQPEAVSEFVDYVRDDEGSFLLTDSRIDRVRNLADATKVNVFADGTIKAIGKQLKEYVKIDCGVFCLDYDIFRALNEVSKHGKYKLSDGIDYFVNRIGKIGTVDIGDYYWQDIDESEDISAAQKKMLSALPDPKDGTVSRHLNRRISMRITKCISRFSISPNQISLFVFFLGMSAGLLFFLGKSLFAGLLAQSSSILDGVDGEIARLKHAKSTIGALVDSLLDRYVDTIIIAGLIYYAYLRTQTLWVLILGAMTLAATPLSMVLKDRFNLLFGRPYNSTRMDGIVRFFLPNRDGRLFLVMIGGIIPKLLLPVLFLLAFSSNIQIITRVLFIKRKLEKKHRKPFPMELKEHSEIHSSLVE